MAGVEENEEVAMREVIFVKLLPRGVGLTSDALASEVSAPFLLPPFRTLLARLMNFDKAGLSSPAPEPAGTDELMIATNSNIRSSG